jgi:hypothetical protein
MSAKDEGKGDRRSDRNNLGKTNDFNRPGKRPCEKLRPHHINKVDKKHQKYSNDANPLEQTTESPRKPIHLI